MQPFAAGEESWWPTLKKLTKSGREEIPVVTPTSPAGIGIGRGDTYIDSLVVSGGGIIELKGFEVDHSTRRTRPLPLSFYSSVVASINGLKVDDPMLFAKKCAVDSGTLVKATGAQIS